MFRFAISLIQFMVVKEPLLILNIVTIIIASLITSLSENLDLNLISFDHLCGLINLTISIV